MQSDGCYEWVNRSITKYREHLFEDISIKTWEYFNSGFMVLHKTHKEFCDKVYEFYNENRDKLVYAQKNFMVGTDQTPINYMIRASEHSINYLDERFNLSQLHLRGVLNPLLSEVGWVWHFNGFEKTERNNIMKQVWDLVKENYVTEK